MEKTMCGTSPRVSMPLPMAGAYLCVLTSLLLSRSAGKSQEILTLISNTGSLHMHNPI